MRIRRSLAALLLLPGLIAALPAAAATAQTDPPALDAADPWIREAPPGRSVSAGYVTLINRSDAPMTITSASSDDARTVEFHTTLTVDGMMRMRRLDEIGIPAHGSVSFAPGGMHLMLFGTAAPRVGAVLDITFHTVGGLDLEVPFPVRTSAPEPAAAGATP